MQPLKDSDRRALWILTIVSLVALAGGIFLATRTKMDAGRPADGQMWKLVLGTLDAVNMELAPSSCIG